MSERDKGTASKRTLYSLAEAATLSGCAVDDLLLKGARGELRICARVPDDVAVYSTNQALIDLSDSALTGLMRKLKEDSLRDVFACPTRDIQLVVLQRSDCDLVVGHGEGFQTLFRAGVRFEDGNVPVVVEPPALKAPAEYFDIRMFRRFAFYADTLDPNDLFARGRLTPKRLRLTTDIMRVLHSDLVQEHAVRNDSILFDIRFREEPYMQPRLIALHKAAMEYWDCSRLGWAPPAEGEVEGWLQEYGGYKAKLAEAGTIFLRRSYANWNQQYYELRKAEGKLTVFETLVVVASAWKTSESALESRDNDVVKYRKKSTAFEFWETYGIKEYLAKHAWRIVAPEHARTSGRPTGLDNS
jgi:hypothetical protein